MNKRIKASKINYVPPEKSNLDHNVRTYPNRKKSNHNETGENKSIRNKKTSSVIILAGLMTAIYLVSSFNSSTERSEPKHNPNGGHMDLKVITEKIDRGEKLTPAEEKRINDIIDYPQ